MVLLYFLRASASFSPPRGTPRTVQNRMSLARRIMLSMRAMVSQSASVRLSHSILKADLAPLLRVKSPVWNRAGRLGIMSSM